MKVQIPHTRRKKPSIHDANRRLTDPWTALIIQEVEALSSNDARCRYLKEQFLSKFVSKETDSAELRKSRAIEKWLATEASNAETNDRLIAYSGDYHIMPRVSWSRFLAICQSKVIEIIGEYPPLEAYIGSFSGGSSTSRLRTESHPASKYIGEAHITSAAEGPWTFIRPEILGWNTAALTTKVVPGNILFTVPKNTTIDRVAAKEPDLNMFMQKGAGAVMRKALRRVGINLNDQTRNQRLARLGSLDGSLATMDLSSASDSVTYNLVELLLPPLWFGYLADIRSPITIIDGIEHVNEMFSSMGNGFTFELESLLFYVIAKTVAYLTGTQGIISVYGDDIICPTGMYHDLAWVLKCCGFAVNPDKSFHTGPFRESCGGHYYAGVDITPFYIRKPIESLIDLIHVANAIRRWSGLSGWTTLATELEPLWFLISESVPRCLWGGRDYGSTTQLVTPGQARSRLVAREQSLDTGLGGYYHWLNSTWDRPILVNDGLTSNDVETSKSSKAVPKYRRRPVVKTGIRPLVIPEYLGELVIPIVSG